MVIVRTLACVLFCAFWMLPTSHAAEPIRLLGTIVKWQYPDAEIRTSNGATSASGGATVDSEGTNTAYSVVLKTTMVTGDSVEDVLTFYRDLLTRNVANDKRFGIQPQVGRSVIFSDESDGRPFALHTIMVHTANVSTVLIITRGSGEDFTYITWKQYLTPELED